VDYTREHGIHVVRRLSGGGAVYHDIGNLNFSFLTKDDGKSFANFRKFTEPVIQALHQLGVPAELSGRNDILVDGKKVSGNAQFSRRGRMFSHGTLMLDVDLEVVSHALQVKKDKIQSKGIKSVRSRVANISEFLPTPITMSAFRSFLLDFIFAGINPIPEYVLTDADWKKIEEISKRRYQNWDWNFGESPAFNVQQRKRFPIGVIDIRLDVAEHGIIDNCKIYGDFFGVGDVADIEQCLIGVRYDREALEQALANIKISHYFGNISKTEFLDLIY
jgi:lipoate-protein ligase A